MSKLSICHAGLLESFLSVKLAICQSYLFVMLATCHSYMSKQLAHLVPVLRKFLVKLPLIIIIYLRFLICSSGSAEQIVWRRPQKKGSPFGPHEARTRLNHTLKTNMKPERVSRGKLSKRVPEKCSKASPFEMVPCLFQTDGFHDHIFFPLRTNREGGSARSAPQRRAEAKNGDRFQLGGAQKNV